MKQCITGQSQERVRPVFISTVHQQCAQMSSGAFGVNSHHTSQEVAEPVGTEQEVELTEKGIGRSYGKESTVIDGKIDPFWPILRVRDQNGVSQA